MERVLFRCERKSSVANVIIVHGIHLPISKSMTHMTVTQVRFLYVEVISHHLWVMAGADKDRASIQRIIATINGSTVG